MPQLENSLNQQISKYKNAAFTMKLSAASLADYTRSQTGSSLIAYKEITGQLRWLSSQQQNITEELFIFIDNPMLSRYKLLLISVSKKIQNLLDDLNLTITHTMLARQSLNRPEIGTKCSFLLHNIDSFYEILDNINQ